MDSNGFFSVYFLKNFIQASEASEHSQSTMEIKFPVIPGCEIVLVVTFSDSVVLTSIAIRRRDKSKKSQPL